MVLYCLESSFLCSWIFLLSPIQCPIVLLSPLYSWEVFCGLDLSPSLVTFLLLNMWASQKLVVSVTLSVFLDFLWKNSLIKGVTSILLWIGIYVFWRFHILFSCRIFLRNLVHWFRKNSSSIFASKTLWFQTLSQCQVYKPWIPRKLETQNNL